ncbi:MAG TPA: hypothetical protein VMV29_09490 [Ktedonobacterales bacterium]|nr:hypothetical protein [Ktedonobacterales bacterium]
MSDTRPSTPNEEQPIVADAFGAPFDSADPDATMDTLPPTTALAFGATDTPGDLETLDALGSPDAEEAPITEDPHEGATPPGYDEWPTHGGYLGCLMGVVLALVLAPVGYILFGLIGSALFQPLGYAGVWLAGAITVIVYLVCFVGLVRLGWRLGKHFYREYPLPAGQVASSFDTPVEGAAHSTVE